MANLTYRFIVNGESIEVSVEDAGSDNVAIILPTKLELLEQYYKTYRWTDRVPNIHIIYVPTQSKLRPGMRCVIPKSAFDSLTESSFLVECPDLKYAKRTTSTSLIKSLRFLGISTPDNYEDGLNERSVRYHYNGGYVLVWSFDDEAYTLTRMIDLVSMIQPMELEECLVLDEDLGKYLSGRGLF